MSFRPISLNRVATHPAAAVLTQGRPVCAYNYISNQLGQIQNTTGSTTNGTARVQYTAAYDMIDVSFVFQCWVSQIGSSPILYGEQIGTLGPITYSNPHLEYNGTSTAIFFNGQSSAVTMNPGAMLVTDVYKVFIPKGATFYVRYYQAVPNGTFVPGYQALYIPNSTWSNFATGAVPDITGNVGATGLTQQPVYSQCMGAIGTPASSSNPIIIGLMGDSIMAGFSTTQNYLSGMVRACAANGVSFMMGACGGDFAINETDDRLSRSRNQLLADCDAILMNYGTNDLYNNSSTVAATQAALLAIWARYGRYSLPIFQSTLIPRVSGTMTSTTTQTTLAAEANRQALNAWLRAPITAGAGQSAMYDAGGSLTGIFEFAGALETNLANATPSITNPNTGGLWYCGPANNTAYSNDGVHPNDTGAIYMIPSVPLNRIGHFQSINVATT